MNQLLTNPVYHALTSGDRHLGFHTGKVGYFDEAVSPFAGFEEGCATGFEALYELLPPERTILHATPGDIPLHRGWQLLQNIKGVQMVLKAECPPLALPLPLVPLEKQQVEQMVQLATLTRPGPFGPRTIEFGHYFGIFDGQRLVAMTGQRLHVAQYSEISAVCTHPDYLGRGYAAALIQHQVQLICSRQLTPFLHVRADNDRAIALYHRLGFSIQRPMNFYFMKREG